MNKPMPIRASLLERAAEVYDFTAAFRAREVGRDDVLELTEVVEAAPGQEPPASLREADRPPAEAEVRIDRETGPRPSPVGHGTPGATQSIDRDELREAGFILPDMPADQLAEEFRIVKRQLLLRAQDGASAKDRMILIGSAHPNEGKTFCAVNLALSMAAEKDVEVLLVDADFAKPEILSTLGLEGGPGIMDAIVDPAIDVESCVIRTDIANLAVLPAGRQTHEATELLASGRAKDLLEKLSINPSRIVIFDSAPALAASPASELALLVGQVVMVVRADRTSESDLREAMGLLAGCEDIRLLLNGVAFAPEGRRFGHYYGYGS